MGKDDRKQNTLAPLPLVFFGGVGGGVSGAHGCGQGESCIYVIEISSARISLVLMPPSHSHSLSPLG
jgi:hypothetical protein